MSGEADTSELSTWATIPGEFLIVESALFFCIISCFLFVLAKPCAIAPIIQEAWHTSRRVSETKLDF